MCEAVQVKYACGCGGRRLGAEACIWKLLNEDLLKTRSASHPIVRSNVRKCNEAKGPKYELKDRKCGNCTKKDKEKAKAKK
jgi:hypothetical protein